VTRAEIEDRLRIKIPLNEWDAHLGADPGPTLIEEVSAEVEQIIHNLRAVSSALLHLVHAFEILTGMDTEPPAGIGNSETEDPARTRCE